MLSWSIDGMDGDALLHDLERRCVECAASDMHVSPEKDAVRLEVRINGMLESLPQPTMQTYEQMLRRVKFLSHLKLNVTTLPQDGQYTFTVPGRVVNVRVATIPSRFGESITLRFLDPKRGIVTLQSLGFPEETSKQLERLARMPYGLVLVTGPTGSGKTTTLYSLLSTIINTKKHIVTLEDPIEYEIKGIVQSEINAEQGYTFASGLRSMLRHDPNVILVGEIRDVETAQTAIDASLTGHLVLSTLHTNSAIEAIPRLLSMGVSPYTFAPALRAVLAQRLVRTLKETYRTGAATIDPANSEIYDGRCVLAELLMVSPKIRDAILIQSEEGVIEEQAKKEGFCSMKMWGETLIESHRTTKEEVERVTS